MSTTALLLAAMAAVVTGSLLARRQPVARRVRIRDRTARR
jgi:uncharacterized integral membrane protein